MNYAASCDQCNGTIDPGSEKTCFDCDGEYCEVCFEDHYLYCIEGNFDICELCGEEIDWCECEEF